MKIELLPIKGVLNVESDTGHKLTVTQGKTVASAPFKEGKASVSIVSFKRPHGAEVTVEDAEGNVLYKKPIVITKAFSVDPVITKRNGSYYLDLRETAPLNRLAVLKIGFRSNDGTLQFAKEYRELMVNSETYELVKLKDFTGKGKLIIQALTRVGERYIRSVDVII